MNRIQKLILFFLLISQPVRSQVLMGESMKLKVETSIRGLSVIDDSVAWISGSNGWVGRTLNGGRDWTFNQLSIFPKLELRTLYAFSSTTAVVANSGSPAHIFLTKDGGLNWSIVYQNENKDAFFDGVDFWNEKEGILYGDPIDGRMLLLRTKDGGQSWSPVTESSPVLAEGEASFAASGTGIRCLKNNRVVIATGGKVSRLWISDDSGLNWKPKATPILQGESSTGIYSVAFQNSKNAIIVGGNYLADTLAMNQAFYTTNSGEQWLLPTTPTRGYRECVEYITKKIVVTTGPRGTDISYDGGMSWKMLSDEKSFHVVRKARKGSLVLMAGNSKVSVVTWSK